MANVYLILKYSSDGENGWLLMESKYKLYKRLFKQSFLQIKYKSQPSLKMENN